MNARISVVFIVLLLIALSCSSRMRLEQARSIAEAGECAGSLTDRAFYNPSTRTWWIDLDLTKQGCAPACVIYENRTSEINWRCTGLLEE